MDISFYQAEQIKLLLKTNFKNYSEILMVGPPGLEPGTCRFYECTALTN